MKKVNSVQSWLPLKKILSNGMIMLKDYSYIKVLKITPINYNLKSNLEKEAILNSYKIFLKTCNFDIQIFIQSIKKDLSNHISNLKNKTKTESKLIQNLSEKYIDYIQDINNQNKSASKNFYILIKEIPKNKKNNYDLENEKIMINNLNEKYFKIKECLSRCGNIVYDFQKKEEIISIIKSFINKKEDDKNNKKIS